jgi:hypothetical protein
MERDGTVSTVFFRCGHFVDFPGDISIPSGKRDLYF